MMRFHLFLQASDSFSQLLFCWVFFVCLFFLLPVGCLNAELLRAGPEGRELRCPKVVGILRAVPW